MNPELIIMAVYDGSGTQEDCYPNTTVLINRFQIQDQTQQFFSQIKNTQIKQECCLHTKSHTGQFTSHQINVYTMKSKQ